MINKIKRQWLGWLSGFLGVITVVLGVRQWQTQQLLQEHLEEYTYEVIDLLWMVAQRLEGVEDGEKLSASVREPLLALRWANEDLSRSLDRIQIFPRDMKSFRFFARYNPSDPYRDSVNTVVGLLLRQTTLEYVDPNNINFQRYFIENCQGLVDYFYLPAVEGQERARRFEKLTPEICQEGFSQFMQDYDDDKAWRLFFPEKYDYLAQ